jgi:AdoMet-dependent heme synthase
MVALGTNDQTAQVSSKGGSTWLRRTRTGQVSRANQNKPRSIFWELTKGCNLRCLHCRASATELSSPSDLSTETVLDIIDQIAAVSTPILVLSGGEPLFRSDVFQLARYSTDRGLRVALATNGTLVTKHCAGMIIDAGVRRVAISLDGADAPTHDAFRGVPGAFDAALAGFHNLKNLGMSMQINTTVARHNAHQLPDLLRLARSLRADALHTFLLVPVGCGVDVAEEQMVPPAEYEKILHWFYDQSLQGGMEFKATCAPHYFRVVEQRRVVERQAAQKTGGVRLPMGRPGMHPAGMNAMTKGCLAGTAVCFISHQGEVYPCGYLPVLAGDLKRQSFAEVWQTSLVFNQLRDVRNLKGKCGCCEFRAVCMGCRARAYAATGNYLDEEPFCAYQPRMSRASASTAVQRQISAAS